VQHNVLRIRVARRVPKTPLARESRHTILVELGRGQRDMEFKRERDGPQAA